jgi:hypothetical protein
MSKRPPRTDISYAELEHARARSHRRAVDVACPLCGPQHKGASAKRKVLRTWSVADGVISLHCVRCDVESYVVADGPVTPKPAATNNKLIDNDDDERRKRKAEMAVRIWNEATPIAGTPGETYYNDGGIDLTLIPDFGGLRWHPQCAWEGGPTCCIIARFTDALTGESRGIHRRSLRKGGTPRSLGPMSECVIRLWPDDAVTDGLVIGEGVETVAAAAAHIIYKNTLLQPAWATGSANNLREFPVLPGVECLTILVDNDVSGTGQGAAAECARRWVAAGREVIRLTPRELGADFNDIVKRGDAA